MRGDAFTPPRLPNDLLALARSPAQERESYPREMGKTGIRRLRSLSFDLCHRVREQLAITAPVFVQTVGLKGKTMTDVDIMTMFNTIARQVEKGKDLPTFTRDSKITALGIDSVS